MELDVCLTRSGDEPWGFRLIGGSDFGMPLTVVKVVANSPAESAGLHNGDVVCQINEADAADMTHERSKGIVALADERLSLKVVRGLYDPVLDDTEPLYESVDQLTDQPDFDQPSLPTEVDYLDLPLNLPRFIEQPGPLPHSLLDQNPDILNDLDFNLNGQNGQVRSQTGSPFVPNLKPYRHFSTEPIKEVPSLEDPIILNPTYQDDFGRLKGEDFLPVTRFKLPISEQYDPDGTKMKKKLKVQEEEVVKEVKSCQEKEMQLKYEEKETKEQLMTKEETASFEEMKNEIDVEKIEMTAFSIVDESIEKAVTVAEEIQKELAVELGEVSTTESSVKEFTKIESKEESEVSTEAKLTQDAKKEVVELVELLDRTTDEIVKQNEYKVEESYEQVVGTTTFEQQDKSVSKRKVSITEVDEMVTDTHVATTNDEVTTSSEASNTSNVTDEQESKIYESETKTSQKSKEKTCEKLSSSTDKKYTTSKLLAEQRAYVIGLQTIPNIRGTAHSSYHYDLLLKTFFIHLTDVMVALSRFILAEPVLSQAQGQTVAETQIRKDVSETATETVSVGKEKVVKQDTVKLEKHKQVEKENQDTANVFSAESQKVNKAVAKQERKSAFVSVQKENAEEKAVVKIKEETQQKTRYDESHVDMTDGIKDEVSKKIVSGSKMAQRTEKKSGELMQKMEAVITEFESKSGGEDIETVRERRSRSHSRAENRDEDLFGEENLTMCEEKSSQLHTKTSSSTVMSSSLSESTNKTSRQKTDYETVTSTGDNNTYVAIVEAHVYTNKDAIFGEHVGVSEISSKINATEKANITKKSVQAVESKKEVIKEKNDIVQKVLKDKKETKKEEIKQGIQEITIKEKEAKKEDQKKTQEIIIAKQEKKLAEVVVAKEEETKKIDKIVGIKEDIKQKTAEIGVSKQEEDKKIATVLAVKQVENKTIADFVVPKREENKKIAEVVVDKQEEKIALAKIAPVQQKQMKKADIVETKEVINEKAKEIAVADNKTVERKEVVFQEKVAPMIETQEITLDHNEVLDHREVSEAKAEMFSTRSKVVTAELVETAEKLSKKEEIKHESTVKEEAQETVKVTERTVIAKSIQEKQEDHTENQTAIVTLKQTTNAVKEEVSTQQSTVALSESVAKEEIKAIAKVKTEEFKTAVTTKEYYKKVRDDVAVVKMEEKKTDMESTFTCKKPEPVVEINKVVAVQEESDKLQETKEKVTKNEKSELQIENSSQFESHTEINNVESQHIKQESTFIARTDVRDLKLALNTEIAKQDSKTSVSSEENGIDTPTPSTVPPTPLTDEYVFKLQIPLPKLSGPPPIRDCTPSDEEEDIYVSKNGLIPVMEAKIGDQTIFDPPLSTPPVSPGSPRSPQSPRSPVPPRSPVYTKPGLKGGSLESSFFQLLAICNSRNSKHSDNVEDQNNVQKDLKTIPKDTIDKSLTVKDSETFPSKNNRPLNIHEDPNIGKENVNPCCTPDCYLNHISSSTPVTSDDDEDPHIVKKSVHPGNNSKRKKQLFSFTPVSFDDDEDPHIVKKEVHPANASDGYLKNLSSSTSVPDPDIVKKGLATKTEGNQEPRIPTPKEPLPETQKSTSLKQPFPVYIKPGLRGGAPGFFGKARPPTFPRYAKPGLRGGADREYTQEEILEIERKSSLLASAIDETIKSIEEYKEEVGITKETEERTTNGVMYNGYAKVVETKVFDANVQTETATEDNINIEQHETLRLADPAVTNGITDAQNGTIAFQNGTLNYDTANGTLTEYSPVKEEHTVKTEIKEEEDKRDHMEGYRAVHFDPEELLNAQRERRALGVRIPQLTASQERELYKTESGELIGTRRGIVDGLEKAVVDPEVGKTLGKPGISEEKIAELISGESEMLREAHVMGLTRVLTSHMNKDDDSSVDFKKLKPIVESLKDSEVLKALNEEMLKAHEEKKKQEEKKWTTFLQKPKRPVPKNKFGFPTEEEKAEPYKVKIVKQPKPKVAPDYKPENFNTGLLPWEERALREPTPPPVAPEEPILIPEEAPEILEAVDPLPESEVPDLEESGIPLPPPEPEQATPPPEEQQENEEPEEELDLEAVVEETEKIVEESLADMERSNMAEQLLMGVQNMVDPNASLDQQLAQMRAQLAALAQLPGVIQQSLELVTKQLSQLTQMEATQTAQEEVTQETTAEAVGETEATQDSTVTIEEMTQEETQEVVQETTPVEKTLTPEELEMMRREEEAMMEEQRKVDKQKKDYKEVIVDYVDTLEAMEQARLEHESRQVKEHSVPRVGKPKPVFGPATPQERPLVLPGGRRWRKPKDAYNDAFIAETLQAQAEIIAGKAKGLSYESVLLPYDERFSKMTRRDEGIYVSLQIEVWNEIWPWGNSKSYNRHYRVNFMKYEKPPVSLDHLKHSDVYKMIHSMDQTPLKRVDMLTPVMAESDYREKCRSMTPCPERLAQQCQP